MYRASRPPRYRSGFLLLETMIGVAIFAIGVLALAKAVQFCLDAELYRRQDNLARKVLENRMAELTSGSTQELTHEVNVVALEGRYEGITLRQWRLELALVDENRAIVPNLHVAYLQAEWQGPNGRQQKEISFYFHETQGL